MYTWDENGQLTAGASSESLVWNWDGKLRSATKAGTNINLKYDPSGNRIYKNSSEAGQRKYIVDIVGDLPVILLELDATDFTVKKTYIYANSQIIAQHNGDYDASRYFYLHDRLGSVRQVIDTSGNIVRLYTYEPFGQTLEDEGTLTNPFMFTGQYRDIETDFDYLRARIYYPYIQRFTSRDPATGKFENPLSLHKYLYCGNDPVNLTDPRGEWALMIGTSVSEVVGTQGATVGIGTYFIFGEEIYFGNYAFYAQGPALGLGASFNVDFTYSPNVEYEADLAGAFYEYGASISVAPFLSIGGSFATSSDYVNPIEFYTFSYGLSLSPPYVPWEGHWDWSGETKVGPKGDFSPTRKLSRFEASASGYNIVLY